MNLLIDFNREVCSFHANELHPLSWVSFGIESCVLWYLGRCQWQLSFARARLIASEVIFYVAPIRPGGMVGSLDWSNYTPIENLGAKFPRRLVEPWHVGDDGPGTMIEARNLAPEKATLGFIAYWVSDCVTDLFLRGAVNADAQFSLSLMQIRGGVSLSPERLREFASMNVRNYDPGSFVGQLPWKP